MLHTTETYCEKDFFSLLNDIWDFSRVKLYKETTFCTTLYDLFLMIFTFVLRVHVHMCDCVRVSVDI